ncbi:SsrA-binding protein SmpB [Candidatus Daviesbacteria bacterium]|nr:SsrA-binding protein SmpB [Candidatus Daviesbacteria bacterium]
MKIFNRRARANYHLLETLEAGIVLSGPEVKSIRAGKVDLSESFARVQNEEVFLKNAYIFPYNGQGKEYDPKRDRKLLLHKEEIKRLLGKISGSATTLIPVSLYTKRNLIKVELALAASKKKYDKRRAIKERDQLRKIEHELKDEQEQR